MGNKACGHINGGRNPNKDSPFERNGQMLTKILQDKCTEYSKVDGTDYIAPSSWVKPLCIIDGVAVECPQGQNNGSQSTGVIIPSNICYENANFGGLFNLNTGLNQKQFTTDYCKNISNSDNIEFFRLPQDDPFFRLVRLGDPAPEWQISQSALDSLKTFVVNEQLLLDYDRNTVVGFSLLGSSYVGKKSIGKVLSKIAKKISRKTQKKVEDSEEGDPVDEEGTNTVEYSSEFDNPTFDQDALVAEDSIIENPDSIASAALDTGAEAGAEAGADAAAEAGAEAAAEASAEAAGLAIPGIGIAVAAVAIAAGFAQDLIDADCSYDSLYPPTLVLNSLGAGCCDGKCIIGGKKTKCVRSGGAGFNASLFSCCMQDYDCYKNKAAPNSDEIQEKCFNIYPPLEKNISGSNIPKIATCHPSFRSLGGSDCGVIVGEYCSGNTAFGINQDTIIDAWSENQTIIFGNKNYNFSVQSPCLNYIARQLVSGVEGLENICNWQQFVDAGLDLLPENLSNIGLLNVQQTIESLLDKYLKESGSPVGKINEDGYIQSSDFLNWFFGFCKKYPFLCQSSLSKFCYNLTASELAEKKETISWCGCYMQDSQYEKYTKFGIQKQCSPLCNLPDTIPLINDAGVKVPCTDSVCMIDDVTIKLANSYTEGPITFNQICGSCGGSKIDIRYNSDYSFLENDNISKFFFLSPLDKDDFNNLTDIFFNGETSSPFYDRNYKNTDLVGFEILDSNSEEDYPILESNGYNIVLNSNSKVFTNINFSLGSPIVVPGTDNIINYIASFSAGSISKLETEDLTNSLSNSDFSKNIFYITNLDGSEVSSKGRFYFKIKYYETGQVKNIDGNTINQTFLDSLVSDVSNFSSAAVVNNCNCTIEGTLDFVNSNISNLNLNNNCSNADCRDFNGNRIPCSSNSIDMTNNSSITNNIIDTVDRNNQKFNSLTETQKNNFLSTVSVSLFVTLVIVHILLTHYPKKYLGIIIAFIFFYILAVIVMYLAYSDSFGIVDTFNNVFGFFKDL